MPQASSAAMDKIQQGKDEQRSRMRLALIKMNEE
jgi:hypothetical protein